MVVCPGVVERKRRASTGDSSNNDRHYSTLSFQVYACMMSRAKRATRIRAARFGGPSSFGLKKERESFPRPMFIGESDPVIYASVDPTRTNPQIDLCPFLKGFMQSAAASSLVPRTSAEAAMFILASVFFCTRQILSLALTCYGR